MKNPVKTSSKIWDDFNNCELTIEHADLPETVRQIVEETIANNTSQCLDPIKAKGQCLRMSDELMLNLSQVGKRPFIDCKIIHTKKPYPHFWLFVEGWHIDLTARQFNPHEPCPKIWKQKEINSNSLYSVEKGKGLVLFQLVPFREGVIPLNSRQRLSLFLKAKLKPSVELFTRIINEGFSNLLKRENSLR